MNAFRVRHLENCLCKFDAVSSISLPLDRYLVTYFKAHPKISHLDKSWISEQAYELLRWKGLIDSVTHPPIAWYSRLKTFYISQRGWLRHIGSLFVLSDAFFPRWKINTQNKNLPEHIRVSFPEVLYDRIVGALGHKKAIQSCMILNEKPPRFLRVNFNRITRDRLYRQLLNKGVPVEKCASSPFGLQLTTNLHLKDVPEYNERLMEIQDESSQLMGLKVKCRPGEKVLDYCSGSGGKAVIFGAALEHQGNLILHDISSNSLKAAKIRLRKAGIRNARTILAGDSAMEALRNKCDWVVCDVPCTGTGSLRRSPELKWHYTDEWLRELLVLQRNIVANSVQYLKRNHGRLVYMTQSILDEENAKQVRYFCLTHGLRLVEEPFHSLPLSRGMDGFFCCILERGNPLVRIEQPGFSIQKEQTGMTRDESVQFSTSEGVCSPTEERIAEIPDTRTTDQNNVIDRSHQKKEYKSEEKSDLVTVDQTGTGTENQRQRKQKPSNQRSVLMVEKERPNSASEVKSKGEEENCEKSASSATASAIHLDDIDVEFVL